MSYSTSRPLGGAHARGRPGRWQRRARARWVVMAFRAKKSGGDQGQIVRRLAREERRQLHTVIGRPRLLAEDGDVERSAPGGSDSRSRCPTMPLPTTTSLGACAHDLPRSVRWFPKKKRRPARVRRGVTYWSRRRCQQTHVLGLLCLSMCNRCAMRHHPCIAARRRLARAVTDLAANAARSCTSACAGRPLPVHSISPTRLGRPLQSRLSVQLGVAQPLQLAP